MTSSHVVVITRGELYAWGNNSHGQLGIGSKKNEKVPTRVKDLEGYFVQTALGQNHSLFLKSDHTLYSCGSNECGQLGTCGPSRAVPGRVQIEGNIIQIACGEVHSLALTSQGDLYAWGYNNHGELGIGTRSNRNEALPVKVGTQVGFIKIGCGADFSVGLGSDGYLYAWGNNYLGQLGLGSRTLNYTLPQIVSLLDVVEFSCGGQHVLALSKMGEVYSWGHNQYGQLGMGYTRTGGTPGKVIGLPALKVVQVACGGGHSMVLLVDGSLYAWGCNSNGEVGVGSSNQMVPVRVTGINEVIIQIRCGFAHSMAITSGYEVYSWGYNGSGQLGNRNNNNTAKPKKMKFQMDGIVFERDEFSSMIYNWPATHTDFPIYKQKILEELLLIFSLHHVFKDLLVYFSKTLLQILF
eukprot:TRINITY_DN6436_c0_g1_i2.p1 TRINITY_DN6436_c0_g1~~TRINITY_DN6436_c0_g1_i2.p1  ORF type:complete len:409 (-),score=66.88 TRINITY_DN6436_c0_g1_i2:45-1271(-)